MNTPSTTVSRVIVLRCGNDLREVAVALPTGDNGHERAAREAMRWATGRDWTQIGAFGRDESVGPPSIRVGNYYAMSGSG